MTPSPRATRARRRVGRIAAMPRAPGDKTGTGGDGSYSFPRELFISGSREEAIHRTSMRLYVVTTRAGADRIRREGFPEYGRYFALTEYGEIVGVPRPRFSDLSWHNVSDFAEGELPKDWEEIAVEFPEGEVSDHETIDPRVATACDTFRRRSPRGICDPRDAPALRRLW
jgi:hypothetical protein